jgi:alpha/beta hydrolase fold
MAGLVRLRGGRQASYEVVGAGEPLLMFPGGPGLPAAIVRADAELLADRFCSYLLDPHGSGASTPPPDPAAYDHCGHADFYEEVREALGLECERARRLVRRDSGADLRRELPRPHHPLRAGRGVGRREPRRGCEKMARDYIAALPIDLYVDGLAARVRAARA